MVNFSFSFSHSIHSFTISHSQKQSASLTVNPVEHRFTSVQHSNISQQFAIFATPIRFFDVFPADRLYSTEFIAFEDCRSMESTASIE